MALSRVTTWAAGNVLTASALNGEFNNILDNALSLISPLTGSLDSNSNSITNIAELHFISGGDATAAGRLRRNSTNITWHDGTSAKKLLLVPSSGGNGKIPRTDSSANNAVTFGAPGGYLYGLTLSNDAGDLTNDIAIAVGECSSNDATWGARSIMALTSILTKKLDVNWAVGDDQGGLDTGSIADTTYHVFLIMRSDTGVVDALFSASPSAPTMPTNYDFKRRIGSIVRASGAILLFDQVDDQFILDVAVLDLASTATSTTAATTALPSIPTGIVVEALLNVQLFSDSAAIVATHLTPLFTTAIDPSTTVAPLSNIMQGTATGSGVFHLSAQMRVFTDTSAQIRIDSTVATGDISIATVGWIDSRGRHA